MMRIQNRSRKGLALLLAVVMMMALAPLGASASGVTTVAVGETKSGYSVTSSTGSTNVSITNVTTSNPSYVTVATWNSSGFSLYGVAAGTATVTIYYTDNDTGNTNQTDTLSVTVSGTSTTTSGGTISVTVGNTVTAPTTFYQIQSVQIANSSLATPAYSTTAGVGTLNIIGLVAGTTTMTVTAIPTSGASAQTYTYTLVVSAANTTTTAASNTITSSHSLAVGQKAPVNNVVSATGIVSSNPSVGTVEMEGTQLMLKALSAGVTDITFTGTQSGATTGVPYKITLTVTGTGSASTSTSSSTGGLVFSKTNRSIDLGKSYRIKGGIKLDGVDIAAADLRWMSSDTDVLTVNATTGIFKGKTSGIAYLVAVDPSSGAVAVLKIDVS